MTFFPYHQNESILPDYLILPKIIICCNQLFTSAASLNYTLLTLLI